jgi:hypothetical protein
MLVYGKGTGHRVVWGIESLYDRDALRSPHNVTYFNRYMSTRTSFRPPPIGAEAPDAIIMNPTGRALTSGQGTLSNIAGTALYAVTGTGTTSATGNVTVTATVATDATVTISGISATSATGNVTVTVSTNATVTITGISATGSVESPSALSGTANTVQTGIGATGDVTTPSNLSGTANTEITGEEETALTGTVVVTATGLTNATVTITGISATITTGNVTVTATGASVTAAGALPAGRKRHAPMAVYPHWQPMVIDAGEKQVSQTVSIEQPELIIANIGKVSVDAVINKTVLDIRHYFAYPREHAKVSVRTEDHPSSAGGVAVVIDYTERRRREEDELIQMILLAA